MTDNLGLPSGVNHPVVKYLPGIQTAPRIEKLNDNLWFVGSDQSRYGGWVVARDEAGNFTCSCPSQSNIVEPLYQDKPSKPRSDRTAAISNQINNAQQYGCKHIAGVQYLLNLHPEAQYELPIQGLNQPTIPTRPTVSSTQVTPLTLATQQAILSGNTASVSCSDLCGYYYQNDIPGYLACVQQCETSRQAPPSPTVEINEACKASCELQFKNNYVDDPVGYYACYLNCTGVDANTYNPTYPDPALYTSVTPVQPLNNEPNYSQDFVHTEQI